MAAAGAVETIATIIAIEDKRLPPNLNLNESEKFEHLDLLKEVIGINYLSSFR